MLEKILTDESFCNLMRIHVYECLEYLLKKDIEFSVLANLSHTSFEPKLPKSIESSFRTPAILFALGGYTLQSSVLSQEELGFEAGFGNENFASVVKIPLGCIIQILIDSKPILINFSVYKPNKDDTKIEKSKQIFMSNPKNKDIFSKK